MFVQNNSGQFQLRKRVDLISDAYQKAWKQKHVDFFKRPSWLQFLLWFAVFS